MYRATVTINPTLTPPSCVRLVAGKASGFQYCLTASITGHTMGDSSIPYFSARCVSLKGSKESGECSSFEEQIERSKSHWSHLAEFDSDDDEVAEVSNVEVFKTLQMHPTWGAFFWRFNEGKGDYGDLVVGEKFAEGGQAELYEAKVTWRSPTNVEKNARDGIKWVVKVFKKGTFLRHLQKQWPLGYLQYYADELEQARSNNTFKPFPRYFCDVMCGTLLKDGRFAFLMVREDEDLRTLIDRSMRLRIGQDSGPFSKELAFDIMCGVADGMGWLHTHNIIHRDLKASNVLVRRCDDKHQYSFVADFECSIGVVGTGFFRAPEILQACRDKNVSRKPEVFTKKADVYSYGMTCYEILTGKLPFEGHSFQEYDIVLSGQRPEIPEYVDAGICRLLHKCWQSNPVDRPSFREIMAKLAVIGVRFRKELECE